MTRTKIIHSFPTLEVTSAELIIMKLIGAALTVISVLAGYGVASLAVLGTTATPPTWITFTTAIAIMVGFFTFRIRTTIRQEAHLKAVREYVCETVSHELLITEEELHRAINGETVLLSNGESIIVGRDGSTMNLAVLS